VLFVIYRNVSGVQTNAHVVHMFVFGVQTNVHVVHMSVSDVQTDVHVVHMSVQCTVGYPQVPSVLSMGRSVHCHCEMTSSFHQSLTQVALTITT